MDDIFDKIRENFDEVKKREAEVARQEGELKSETEILCRKAVELDEIRRQNEEQAAALAKEKATMSHVSVTDEDIVTLNVQGEIFCTLRGTLTQFPETKMAYMFNGRWHDKVHKDEKGNIFLDFPPAIFRKFLDYLTCRKLSESPCVAPPDVGQEQMPLFKLMLGHFEVEESVYKRISCLCSALKSPFISLSDDCRTATNNSPGMGYILGTEVYYNERVHFELEIEKLENSWMFFGVMCDDPTRKSVITDRSFNGNPTAFGWADQGGLWKAGVRQKESDCTIPPNVLCEGVCVEMVLDCRTGESASLSIKVVPSGHVQEILDLPGGLSWRLHINLVDTNDSVRLLSAERIETTSS